MTRIMEQVLKQSQKWDARKVSVESSHRIEVFCSIVVGVSIRCYSTLVISVLWLYLVGKGADRKQSTKANSICCSIPKN